MTKQHWTLFSNVLATMVFSAALVWTLTNGVQTTMGPLLRYGHYWILTLLSSLWLVVFIQMRQSDKQTLWDHAKKHRVACGLTLLMALGVILSVGPEFRALKDEIAFLSTSLALLEQHQVGIFTEATFVKSLLTLFEFEDPGRPSLFPYLIHLVHIVSGYRTQNVFLLNGFLLWLFLLGLTTFFHKRLGLGSALVICLLVISQPIFSLSVTSGGYDFCHLVLLSVCLWALSAFVEQPKALTFQWLWINLILLGHVRPEGDAYLVIMIFVLIIFKYVKGNYLQPAWFYLLSLLTFFPMIWQKMGSGSYFLPPPNAIPKNEAVFAVSHFLENQLVFLRHLWWFDSSLPFAGLINAVGFICIVYFVGNSLRHGKSASRQKVFLPNLVAMTCGLFHWGLFSAYYYGRMDLENAGRFYLVPMSILSVCAGILLHRVFKPKSKRRILMYLFALVCFFVYHPIALRGDFVDESAFRRNHDLIKEFMDDQKDPRLLIVSDIPGPFIVSRYSSISMNVFFENREQYLRELYEGRYSHIYIAQRIDPRTKQPAIGNAVPSDIKYKVISKENALMRFLKVIPFFQPVRVNP